MRQPTLAAHGVWLKYDCGLDGSPLAGGSCCTSYCAVLVLSKLLLTVLGRQGELSISHTGGIVRHVCPVLVCG